MRDRASDARVRYAARLARGAGGVGRTVRIAAAPAAPVDAAAPPLELAVGIRLAREGIAGVARLAEHLSVRGSAARVVGKQSASITQPSTHRARPSTSTHTAWAKAASHSASPVHGATPQTPASHTKSYGYARTTATATSSSSGPQQSTASSHAGWHTLGAGSPPLVPVSAAPLDAVDDGAPPSLAEVVPPPLCEHAITSTSPETQHAMWRRASAPWLLRVLFGVCGRRAAASLLLLHVDEQPSVALPSNSRGSRPAGPRRASGR